MTEVKRGRGRPPKVRLEALPEEEDTGEAGISLIEPIAEPTPAKKTEQPSEKLVEVEMIRKYCPDGQPQEIKKTVPAGSVIFLPMTEARDALKRGIARATDRTFD